MTATKTATKTATTVMTTMVTPFICILYLDFFRKNASSSYSLKAMSCFDYRNNQFPRNLFTIAQVRSYVDEVNSSLDETTISGISNVLLKNDDQICLVTFTTWQCKLRK